MNAPKARRPKLEMLSPDLVEKILGEAMEILNDLGVFVENEEAFSLLAEAGCKVDTVSRRVHIGENLVRLSLGQAPKAIQMFDAAGHPAMDLSGDNVHFDPGSAAVNVYDYEAKTIRKPTSADVVSFIKLTARLENYAAQSTGVVPADVPEEFADRYRLYLGLLHCSKPVVTGTFEVDAFQPMKDMLIAVRGSADALRDKSIGVRVNASLRGNGPGHAVGFHRPAHGRDPERRGHCSARPGRGARHLRWIPFDLRHEERNHADGCD